MIWNVLFTSVALLAPFFLSEPLGQPEDAKPEKTVVVEVTTHDEGTAASSTPVVKTEAITLVMGEKDGDFYVDSDDSTTPKEGSCTKHIVIKTDAQGGTGEGQKQEHVIVSEGEGPMVYIDSDEGKNGEKVKTFIRMKNIEMLKDLKDGETRTLGEGEEAVVATRQGDKIVMKLKDGKELSFVPIHGKFEVDGKTHCSVVCKTAKTDSHALYLVKTKGDTGKTKEFDLRLRSDNAKVKIMVNKETFDLTTSDLVEGTPKTYTVGENTLTLTRDGEKVHVKIEKTPIIP